jgi:hypothetical protein
VPLLCLAALYVAVILLPLQWGAERLRRLEI